LFQKEISVTLLISLKMLKLTAVVTTSRLKPNAQQPANGIADHQLDPREVIVEP
jgi:hypothetical protein